MSEQYRERKNELSPSTAGFSATNGRAVMQILIDAADYLPEDVLPDLLGDTRFGSAGRLRRRPPKAHPLYDWLFCSAVSTVQGIGETQQEFNWNSFFSANALDRYVEYTEYLMTVEFTPRPYAVLSDDAVTVDTLEWYKDDGTPSGSVPYAEEWKRWVSRSVVPQSELISGRQGEMVFRTDDTTTDSAVGVSPPNRVSFGAAPRMLYPNTLFRYRWHQVPLAYVTARRCPINAFIGRVNQQHFDGFEPGELLYLNYAVSDPYVPPLPARQLVAGEQVFDTFKLVDIDFHFLYTDRVDGSPYTGPTITNPNWIKAGHNLLPWLYDRKFYYATVGALKTTDTDKAKWTPTFLSCPFQLLFTDPAVVTL